MRKNSFLPSEKDMNQAIKILICNKNIALVGNVKTFYKQLLYNNVCRVVPFI